MSTKSQYPAGWDESRVKKVLEHYEGQSEDEALLEDELAYEDQTQTLIEVPVELLPAIRELIAKHKDHDAT